MLFEGGMNILNIILSGLKVEDKRDGRINRERRESSKGKFDSLLLSFSQFAEGTRDPVNLKVKKDLSSESRLGALKLGRLARDLERKSGVIGLKLLPGRAEVGYREKLEGWPVNLYSDRDKKEVGEVCCVHTGGKTIPTQTELNFDTALRFKLSREPEVTSGKEFQFGIKGGREVERRFSRSSSMFHGGFPDGDLNVSGVVPIKMVNHYSYRRISGNVHGSYVNVAVLNSDPSLQVVKRGAPRRSRLTNGTLERGDQGGTSKRYGIYSKLTFKDMNKLEFLSIKRNSCVYCFTKPTGIFDTSTERLADTREETFDSKGIILTADFMSAKESVLLEYRHKLPKFLIESRLISGVERKNQLAKVDYHREIDYTFGNIKGKLKVEREKGADRNLTKASFPPGKLPVPERAAVDRRSPPPVHLFTTSSKVPHTPLSDVSHSVQHQHTENLSYSFSTPFTSSLPLDNSFSSPGGRQSFTGEEKYPSRQFYSFSGDNEVQISYIDKNFKLSVISIGRVLNLNLQVLDEFHLDPSTVRDITAIIESSGYLPGKIVLRHRKERYAAYESRSAKRLELRI